MNTQPDASFSHLENRPPMIEAPQGETSLQQVLGQRVPAWKIAGRIGDMIEATCRSGPDAGQPDWKTVEAGIQLYLEFTARRPWPPAGHPGTEESGPSRPPARLQEPAHQMEAALRQGGAAGENAPTPAQRKNRLSQNIEDLERMRKLMNYGTPLGALMKQNQADSAPVPWRSEMPLLPAPGPPQSFSGPVSISFVPATAPASRPVSWLALVSSLTIAGLAGSLYIVSNRPPPGAAAAGIGLPAQDARGEFPRLPPEPVPAAKPPETGVAAFSPRFETTMW